MRAWRWIFPVVVFCAAAGCAQQYPPDLSDRLGVTHMNGKYFFTKQDYLDEGADQVIATGSHVIKLYLARGTPEKYPWNSNWAKSYASLTELAQSPYFQSVFSKPQLHTYIITTYSIGIPGVPPEHEANYWLDTMTDAQIAAETQSFYDLSKYLIQTYAGTGKTFIFENWEGDWAIRADRAHPGVRHNPSPQTVQRMIQWFNARQAGVNKARSELAASGSDVKVFNSVEVNRVQDAMNEGTSFKGATLTNDVLPFTTVDFASYSSYDTLHNLLGPYSFDKAVAYIAAHLPPTAVHGRTTQSVYIGEFGIPENQKPAPDVNRAVSNVVRTLIADRMPYAIYWEIYCNELIDKTITHPVNGKDDAVRGFFMVKPDGSPSLVWGRYQQIFSAADPARANADALKAKLSLQFQDDFNRPDGTNLGTGWSQSAHYGTVDKYLSHGCLTMRVENAAHIPWGSVTLDLTNPAILGRGLNVGEYFEVTMKRLTDYGMLGVELFGSDQIRQGSGENADPSPLRAWTGVTWSPFSIDDQGNPLAFNWNAQHTLGVRFDSADGHFAAFSYYVDGQYAGSWLRKVGNKTLNRIGVFVQSHGSNAKFEFYDIKVYAAPRREAVAPAPKRTGSLGMAD